jgi:hypothetical protein
LLGLKRGASLPEVEDAWRLRSAAFHPDRFPAESKQWATGRTQEINNARDELRRYWRERREADRREPEYELNVRRAPPPADPEPIQPEPVRPDTVGFEPEPGGPAGAAEPIGAPDPPPSPGFRRGAVLAYAVAALFVFVALLGASAALLRDGDGHAEAPALQSPEPPRQIAVNRPEPAGTAAAGERAAVTGLATGDTRETAGAILSPKAPDEPQPAADKAPERKEASADTRPRAEPAAEAMEPPASAPASPQSDAGIRLPPIPAEPAAQAAPPAPSQQGRAKPRAQPSPVEPSPVSAGAAPASRAAPRPPSAAGRTTLVTAAIQACRNDLQRFCPGVQPGGGRIAQCARQHFRQFSGECSQALLAVRAARSDKGSAARRY